MIVSWLLKSSSKTITFTILMIFLISACSSEGSAAAANSNASDNGITNSTKNKESTSNQPATITGTNTGKVTEDLDSNGDGLLGASGKLNISDSDPGEAAFVAEFINSKYGSITIDSSGNWFYGAVNTLNSIQALDKNETLTDRLTVRSVDGTSHNITITIYGVNEPTTSSGSSTDSSGSSSSGTTTPPADTGASDPVDTGTSQPVEPANNPAVISGKSTGSVTEDNDPDGDNLLETSGTLTITDSDAGEAAFIAKTVSGSRGSLKINSTGNWNYSADNNQSVIQNLASGDTLTERLTVSSIDGTTHTIVITILGVDEASVSTADITLSWVAPAEREDNTAISLSEISGYKVYYGVNKGSYDNSVNINDGTADSYTLTNLPAGTYYFVITTKDTDGRESQYSSEITVVI